MSSVSCILRVDAIGLFYGKKRSCWCTLSAGRPTIQLVRCALGTWLLEHVAILFIFMPETDDSESCRYSLFLCFAAHRSATMESSALNTAHEKIRRAEALSREGRFKEASDCHGQAAELFMQVHTQIAGNLVDNPPMVHSDPSFMTLESLNLQHEYHTRQAKIASMKQVQLDEYRQTLQKKPSIAADKMIPERLQKDMASMITDGYLKLAIFKTIEEQDSLLNLMLLPDDKNAFKHPKDTGTVIEELRTVNKHLRTLVGSLLDKLETKENEVRLLKERLETLTPDSTVEVRLEESHSTRLAPLPPLAPLGMPLFDFPSFMWPVNSREGDDSQRKNEEELEEEEEDVISS